MKKYLLTIILALCVCSLPLMGGRLRVGDWIECEGIRGKGDRHQLPMRAETIEGTGMSFLNSSLFGKNFNNLTRNHSYELTTITVGVAYGTDINLVRKVLVEGMQEMRTKDRYGREVVEPKYGVNVVVGNMSDSSVDINVYKRENKVSNPTLERKKESSCC